MNLLLKYLFRKGIPPEKEAQFLVNYSGKWAFDLFTDKQFRDAIKFDQQKPVEQDRIFNELVVTTLVFLLAFLEEQHEKIEPKRQEFWQEIMDKVPNCFTNYLQKIKIPDKYITMWQKLLSLRIQEYEKNKTETSHMVWRKEIELPDEKMHDAFIRLETLRVSSMLHITRGKAKPDHPLKRILRTWLIGFNNRLMQRVGW